MRKKSRAARTLVKVFEISEFKVLTTTRTYNFKSFILHIYFNGASTSTFAADVREKQ